MAIICLGSVYFAGCMPIDELSIAQPEENEDPRQAALPIIAADRALTSLNCAGSQPPLVTDLEVRQPPQLAEPAPRAPFRDPVFGTCLVRVTDRETDLPPDHESPGLKNEYSRVQSFNADGSAVLVYGTAGEWFLYDGVSLAFQGELPLGAEPRWDAVDPNLITYTDETRLMIFDVAAGEAQILHDFAADLDGHNVSAVWTAFEGRPSADSRYYGLMAEDEEWLPSAFLIYDRQTGDVVVRDMRGVPGIEEDVDHVTITPLGTYFLASFDRYCGEGQLGDDAYPCGLMVYDSSLASSRGLLRTIGHYDLALDAQGQEVVVFQDIDNDQIAMLNLASGVVTPLWDIDFSHTPLGFHFSGLAYDMPGWALASTYSGGYPDAFTWMDDQVLAIELKEAGRIVRLAHTRSLVNEDLEHDYWAEPQATVNQDFSCVLFTTNWGRSGTEEVEMLMVQLPEGWSEEAITAP